MSFLRFGRYVVVWSILVLVLAVILEVLLPRFEVDRHRLVLTLALATVGLADLGVYAVVGFGLLVRRERFVHLWGVSLAVKFLWFGIASAVAILVVGLSTKSFLLVLASLYPIFTIHQVVSLVKHADAAGLGVKAELHDHN